METVIIVAVCISLVLNVILLVLCISRKQKDYTADFNSIERAIEKNNARQDAAASQLRQEMLVQFTHLGESNMSMLSKMSVTTEENLRDMRSTMDRRLISVQEENERRLTEVRETMEKHLASMQADNEKRLNEMRDTVDRKLTESLTTGLENSFKTVNNQLEQVYKSMGEMRSLTTGIVDLKNILSNVKTRGGWGEAQLGRIIEDILAPSQYEKEVQIGRSRERVEYAVKLPGAGDEPVYMPIDSKFPMDRYASVLDAQESGNGYAAAVDALCRAVMEEGKKIKTKYILPPETTDFAVMFVPSEGLYSLLASNDMIYRLQNEHRVMLAGPSTFTALLNSLLVGFRTLAIEKQSADIFKLLGAIKTSFERFTGNIDKTLKSLQAATNNLEKVGSNSRSIERKLKGIEQLAEPEAKELLGSQFFEDEEE